MSWINIFSIYTLNFTMKLFLLTFNLNILGQFIFINYYSIFVKFFTYNSSLFQIDIYPVSGIFIQNMGTWSSCRKYWRDFRRARIGSKYWWILLQLRKYFCFGSTRLSSPILRYLLPQDNWLELHPNPSIIFWLFLWYFLIKLCIGTYH